MRFDRKIFQSTSDKIFQLIDGKIVNFVNYKNKFYPKRTQATPIDVAN